MLEFTHTDLVLLLIAIGVVLILSRFVSELGKKFKLPIVMGEIFIGVLLGPSVLGKLWPDMFTALFPRIGAEKIAFDGIVSLAVIMLLFVAGLEVQLNVILKQGKAAIYTSLTSMIIPFIIGFGVVWFFPNTFECKANNVSIYALFFGTAMAISALPVITRILMDLNIFKTKVGMVIISAAIFSDLIGWLVFSLILSLIGQQETTHQVSYTIGMILIFGLFMLFIGKRLIDKSLPWIQTKLSWPGGVLSISLGFCFLGAAFTEKIGLHAILGAFIMGLSFGDSVHLHEKAREIIHQFVTNVFAPLFFVSLGLKVDFISNFDLQLVLIVLVIAVFCKSLGASLGAYWGGLTKRESLAVGFGLNARGAMEIILGTLALNAGLINEKMFVALVVMALVTSMISGPLIKYFIGDQISKS
jgi:Kef-type K+ transport system membrane component KefB